MRYPTPERNLLQIASLLSLSGAIHRTVSWSSASSYGEALPAPFVVKELTNSVWLTNNLYDLDVVSLLWFLSGEEVNTCAD